MKETKLKDRLNKTFDNFFQNSSQENHEANITHNPENSFLPEEKTSRKKLTKALNILRQIFLFLPATFVTFYMWMGMTIFGFPTNDKTLFISLMLISPILMVLGLGNVKNLRHWLSPLSVIILGVLIGLIPNLLPFLRSLFLKFENAILLLPLALIVAVLSKNWVDSLDEKDVH